MKTASLHTLTILALLSSPALAGPLREAKIHQIVNDVKIVEPRTGARPATLRDTIKDDIGVTTGPQSRAELLFQDKTLTRLGAETFFSFEPGTRNVTHERGSMLLQVPKNRGGAHIRAASVSASITGTTVTVEHLRAHEVRITVLEGSLDVNLSRRPAERATLLAGMTVTIPPNAKKLPRPTAVNLRTLVRTSPLVTPALFNAQSESRAATLPSMGLIEKEIARQEGTPGGAARKSVAVASSNELAALLASGQPDASGKVEFSHANAANPAPDSAKKSGPSRTNPHARTSGASSQLSATAARTNVGNERAANSAATNISASSLSALITSGNSGNSGNSGGNGSGNGGNGNATSNGNGNGGGNGNSGGSNGNGGGSAKKKKK
jgi:hypothetical protein